MAAACFAGGSWKTTGQETPEQETLEIQYTSSNSDSSTFNVAKDIEVLRFEDPTSLTLLDGLTKLHTLIIDATNAGYPSDPPFNLVSLKLSKDLGKDADWPFRLMLRNQSSFSLSAHKEMSPFEVTLIETMTIRISPAQDLIKNRPPEDDGVFRIPVDISHIIWRIIGVIEVYDVPPRITITRKEDGVEIVWDRDTLQSDPTIDGPWKDVTFDETRCLFLRSSLPAEFFRVKP